MSSSESDDGEAPPLQADAGLPIRQAEPPREEEGPYRRTIRVTEEGPHRRVVRLTGQTSPERTVRPVGPRSILRITRRMDPHRSVERTVRFADDPDLNSAANPALSVDPAAISRADARLPFIPTPAADTRLPPPSTAAACLPSTSSAIPSLMDIPLPQSQDSRCRSLRPSPGDPSSRPLTGVGSVSSVPFAAGREEPLPRRKRRKPKKPNAQSCPICGIVPINLRHHVQWQHLPHWFQLEASCIDCGIVFETIIERADHHVTERHPVRDEEVLAVRWMLGARNLLALLSEVSGRHLMELHQWVEENQWQASPTVAYGATYAALLRDLSGFLQIPVPIHIPLQPHQLMNPVCILHWRILMLVLAALPVEARARIRALPFPENNDGEEAPVPLPPAIDAHCHLSRLYQLRNPGEVYQAGPFRRAGIMDNRVFPHEWSQPPLDVTGIPMVLTGYGAHPSLAGAHRFQWAEVERLTGSADFIGECGLDIVRGAEQQVAQEELLRKQVRLAIASGKPLVLHLRGGLTLFQRAQSILQQERLSAEHRVYIHCYTGDMVLYENWTRMFPHSIFGVSSITITTAVSQEFCRRADLRHVVLESDAPYLGRRAFDILPLANHLAVLRNASQRTILGATAHTAAHFFS